MRWLRMQENEVGEWSILDARRGYRICAYNHGKHGGPHIHFPPDAPAIARVEIGSMADARRIMLAFAATHATFDLARIKQEVNTWKS
ncbi:MAG: hypothetical protein ACYDDF_12845 [Thermoplasmatota archaeon]